MATVEQVQRHVNHCATCDEGRTCAMLAVILSGTADDAGYRRLLTRIHEVTGISQAIAIDCVSIVVEQRNEAERLLLDFVAHSSFHEWSDGDGVSCWYCGRTRVEHPCDDCEWGKAKRYLVERGLLAKEPA